MRTSSVEGYVMPSLLWRAAPKSFMLARRSMTPLGMRVCVVSTCTVRTTFSTPLSHRR
jgi:hypothetical protein